MPFRAISRTAILATAMAVALTGCGSGSSPAPTGSAGPPAASASAIPSAIASAVASALASAVASQAANASPLPMSVKSLTKSAKPGDKAGITVVTEDGAACTITVSYQNGPTTASGLAPAVAASNGYVSWGWTVDADAQAGEWPVDVLCAKGTRTGELHEKLTVK